MEKNSQKHWNWILMKYTKEQIQEIIEDNTFTGAAAQLRFIEWKKIDEGKVAKSA